MEKGSIILSTTVQNLKKCIGWGRLKMKAQCKDVGQVVIATIHKLHSVLRNFEFILNANEKLSKENYY